MTVLKIHHKYVDNRGTEQKVQAVLILLRWCMCWRWDVDAILTHFHINEVLFCLRYDIYAEKNSTMNSEFARPMNWLNRLQWISINTRSFLMPSAQHYLSRITFWQVVRFLTFYVPSHRWYPKYWCWNVGGSISASNHG